MHPTSDDFKCWNREDETPPPGADVVKLLADLFPQVPRQDEDVVGLGLGQVLGRIDGDVRARKEFPLLNRAPVHGVRQEIESGCRSD